MKRPTGGFTRMNMPWLSIWEGLCDVWRPNWKVREAAMAPPCQVRFGPFLLVDGTPAMPVEASSPTP